MLGSWRISLNAAMQCQVKGKIEEKALWIMIMCSPLKQLKFWTLILKSLPEPTQQLYVLHIRSKEVTMLYNIINNITVPFSCQPSFPQHPPSDPPYQ